MRKIISGILSLAMTLSLAIPLSAQQITTPTTGETIVSYGVSEGFTVVIPSDFTISTETKKATATVSAMNVMLAHGATLNVIVSGDDYVDSWKLVDAQEENNQLTYTIGTTEGGSDIINNSVVLSVESGEAHNSTKSANMHFTVIDTLTKSGTYNDILTFIVDVGNKVYSTEELQEKYEFKYYSSLSSAVNEVNNGTIGQNYDATKNDAVAGIYTDGSGNNVVVLLSDHTETEKIAATTDMTINLGGNTLTFENTSAGISTASATPANVTIDGRLEGSTIFLSNVAGEYARAISFFSGECSILGGTYVVEGENTGKKGNNASVMIGGSANVNISDATIIMEDYGTSTSVRGIHINSTASATIKNSDIRAYVNYSNNAQSMGINNRGVLHISNSYAYGTHSAIGTSGTLYVDGGTYEGYGHGGIYFGGTGVISYVKNAKLNDAAMPAGYTASTNSNHAGLYIGGNNTSNNITAYIDNCDIYGSAQPIVFRSSDGEKNNTIYISNSNINLDYTSWGIRIDSDTHKLYIGTGNNFDINNTTAPQCVIETNETYSH